MIRILGPSLELGTHTDTYKKGTPRNFRVQCTQCVYEDTNFNEYTLSAQIMNLNEVTHANPDVYLLMQSAEDFDGQYIFLSNFLTMNERADAPDRIHSRPLVKYSFSQWRKLRTVSQSKRVNVSKRGWSLWSTYYPYPLSISAKITGRYSCKIWPDSLVSSTGLSRTLVVIWLRRTCIILSQYM